MAKEAFSFQMIARLAFLRAKVRAVHHFLIRLIFHFSYLGKMYLDFLKKASISITPPKSLGYGMKNLLEMIMAHFLLLMCKF